MSNESALQVRAAPFCKFRGMNMKTTNKVLILFTLAMASASSAIGANSSEANHKVLYNPHVPSQIRKRTRTISATRFYGETVVNGQKVALHFYDLQPMKKINDQNARQNSQLDIFIETRHQKQRVFERVNSIPVTYYRWSGGKLILQMEVLWLDTTSRTKPIIKVRVETRASSGENSGDDILFAFPKGLKSSAVTQKFPFNYLSGPSGASSNAFDKADENGFVTIFQEYGGISGINYTAWKWNSRKFAKVQELDIETDQPKRYQWNGKELIEK